MTDAPNGAPGGVHNTEYGNHRDDDTRTHMPCGTTQSAQKRVERINRGSRCLVDLVAPAESPRSNAYILTFYSYTW